MTETMKAFLEAVSKDEEQGKKIRKMADKAEILAAAKEMGYALTEADFEAPEGEMSEKELAGVSGGGDCYCAAGGGGTEGEWGDEVCACVFIGYGMGYMVHDRCRCALYGYGKSEEG